MNAKRAKKIRKALVVGREESGMSRGAFTRLLTRYKTIPVRIKFEGSNSTILQPMSTKRRDKLDLRHDMIKASRNGIFTNWALQELFGEPQIKKPVVVVEPECPRGFIKKFKKEWKKRGSRS